MQTLDWNKWKEEFEALCASEDDPYGPEGPIKACGEECWRQLFDEGMSPQDALDSDRQHWEE